MRSSFKRFYSDVSLAGDTGSRTWSLLLDGKLARTPAGHPFIIAYPELAQSVAQEWQVQGETANLASMPLSRLAMSVLDHVAPRAPSIRQEALAYGRTDLLCYRATEPARLAERQAVLWQPYLDWAASELGAQLRTATGLAVIEQDPEALAALGRSVESFDSYRLLVLHGLTARLGSIVLALAVLHGRASISDTIAASRVDEIFQLEVWGRDEGADERARQVEAEAKDLKRFWDLLA